MEFHLRWGGAARHLAPPSPSLVTSLVHDHVRRTWRLSLASVRHSWSWRRVL